MPGVTWWKLTNSIMVRRAGRKPTFARPAASVSLGSKRSYAAKCINGGFGPKVDLEIGAAKDRRVPHSSRSGRMQRMSAKSPLYRFSAMQLKSAFEIA